MKFNLSSDFERRKATDYLAKLCANESGTVEVRKIGKPRSMNQNRYYWSLLTIYGIEIGQTKDEMAVDMKRAYGLSYEKNAKAYLRSSASLSSGLMTAFIDFIRNHAGQSGIYLPTADELQQNWAYYDRLIDQHKEHIGTEETT
jgi:hypothetical protein